MIIRATFEEPGITIDDIEVAQFIFLMLNNPKIGVAAVSLPKHGTTNEFIGGTCHQPRAAQSG